MPAAEEKLYTDGEPIHCSYRLSSFLLLLLFILHREETVEVVWASGRDVWKISSVELVLLMDLLSEGLENETKKSNS